MVVHAEDRRDQVGALAPERLRVPEQLAEAEAVLEQHGVDRARPWSVAARPAEVVVVQLPAAERVQHLDRVPQVDRVPGVEAREAEVAVAEHAAQLLGVRSRRS